MIARTFSEVESQADLRGARFDRAILAGVDLSGFDLREVDLVGADLEDTLLAGAILGSGC